MRRDAPAAASTAAAALSSAGPAVDAIDAVVAGISDAGAVAKGAQDGEAFNGVRLAGYRTLVVPRRGGVPDCGGRALYVCSETSDFRNVARTLPARTAIVEVGCSYGACSKILFKHAATLLGIDVSEEPLASAREKCPAANFVALDGLKDPVALRGLLELERMKALEFGLETALFVDVGGEGLQGACFKLLTLSASALAPTHLICVKNRALWKAASGQAKGCDNKRNRIAAAAAAQNRKNGTILKYALDYPPRLKENSTVFLCRFHNFGKGGCYREFCDYDHETCYNCGMQGHKASECACNAYKACDRKDSDGAREQEDSDARAPRGPDPDAGAAPTAF